jgi:hypothetical protein
MTKIVDISSKKPPAEVCMFCDNPHSSLKCPRVEFLALFDDGSVQEVGFFAPAVWKEYE